MQRRGLRVRQQRAIWWACGCGDGGKGHCQQKAGTQGNPGTQGLHILHTNSHIQIHTHRHTVVFHHVCRVQQLNIRIWRNKRSLRLQFSSYCRNSAAETRPKLQHDALLTAFVNGAQFTTVMKTKQKSAEGWITCSHEIWETPFKALKKRSRRRNRCSHTPLERAHTYTRMHTSPSQLSLTGGSLVQVPMETNLLWAMADGEGAGGLNLSPSILSDCMGKVAAGSEEGKRMASKQRRDPWPPHA